MPRHGGPSCADCPELSAFPVIHGFIVVCKARGWPGSLYAKATSGANIHAGVIGEAQSCRSIAAVIENKGIVRALEFYSGPAVLLGDIILRIATDREINAVAVTLM